MKKGNEQLEKRIAELEVQLHEQKYMHINLPRIGLFLLAIVCVALCIGNFMLIQDLQKIRPIMSFDGQDSKTQLVIVWAIIGEIALLFLTATQILAAIRGRYYFPNCARWGAVAGSVISVVISIVALVFLLIAPWVDKNIFSYIIDFAGIWGILASTGLFIGFIFDVMASKHEWVKWK